MQLLASQFCVLLWLKWSLFTPSSLSFTLFIFVVFIGGTDAYINHVLEAWGTEITLYPVCWGFFSVTLEVLQKSHQLSHSRQKQAWQYWEVLSGWHLNSVKKQEHGWAAHWTIMSKLYIFWHIVGVRQFSLCYFRLWVKHIDHLTLFIWIRQKSHHKMTARSSPQLLLL